MIRLVFTASQTWLGRIIRRLTGGKVSHAFIEYPSTTWGGNWVAEATFIGVRMVPAEKARRYVIAEYDCLFPTDEPLRVVARYTGEFYDYLGLLKFGWALILWNLFKVKIRNPSRSTRGLFCSEFVARFLISARLPLTHDWNAERISPEMLRHYCQSQPKYFAEKKA